MLKRVPLYAQILIGMALGIVAGFAAISLGFDKFISNWIAPFGDMFIKLLKVVAVPLVFLSLIKGITGLNEIKSLSSMGLKTLALYICTTVVAITVGIVAVTTIKPGSIFPEDKGVELRERYQGEVAQKSVTASEVEQESSLQFLVDMIPDNFTAAMSSNGNMLQVIFLAIFIGATMVAIGVVKLKPAVDLIDSLNTIVVKMIDYIMLTAPYGVFALMAALVVDSMGDVAIFKALGLYSLTVIISLLLLIFIFYPTLIKLFTKIDVKRFIRSAAPVQLLGFSTSSSAATLPMTMEQCQKGLGLSHRASSFVLPVGVTINMDGTSCYQAVAVVFIAQVMGIDLTMSQILTIIGLTTVASIGTPGIPGGSIVMTVMVLSSIGIPSEGLALILGVDRPLDMLRTAVNVTGDMAVASMVDNESKE